MRGPAFPRVIEGMGTHARHSPPPQLSSCPFAGGGFPTPIHFYPTRIARSCTGPRSSWSCSCLRRALPRMRAHGYAQAARLGAFPDVRVGSATLARTHAHTHARLRP
eukprot:6185180-Pleurochrysis_carterae.AAC.1